MFGLLSSSSSSKADDNGAAKPAPDAEVPSVIPTNFDAASLHPMADLGKQTLDYLELDTNTNRAEGLIASRGFFEDLSYGTGAMYLLGLGVGGAYGLAEGLRSTSPSMSAKLRTNAILNSITRRGPYLGNLSGVLTLTYSFVDGSIDALRGHHDDAGSLAAGAVTGALWNASRGFKPMLISSALLTSAAAGWSVFKRVVAPADDE